MGFEQRQRTHPSHTPKKNFWENIGYTIPLIVGALLVSCCIGWYLIFAAASAITSILGVVLLAVAFCGASLITSHDLIEDAFTDDDREQRFEEALGTSADHDLPRSPLSKLSSQTPSNTSHDFSPTPEKSVLSSSELTQGHTNTSTDEPSPTIPSTDGPKA